MGIAIEEVVATNDEGVRGVGAGAMEARALGVRVCFSDRMARVGPS